MMANTYETVENKKFLNSEGVGRLWTKIRERYDAKLDNIVAADKSVAVADNNKISVQISEDQDNLLVLKNDGLFVQAPDNQDTYTIQKSTATSEYAAVYQLMKYEGGTGTPTQVGVDINIPKDMVVSSGTVETKSAAGEWGAAGTYIHLILANATNSDLYIAVDNLIEYVTSGSQAGDPIVIAVDSNHRVTATITDGAITKSKLATDVQNSLNLADSAVQNITEGSGNGTIAVDGVDVSVHGLGSAAFTSTTDYDVAGSAADVLGTNSDTSNKVSVYGVKAYASEAYAAIQALTNTEIDNAISAANA